MFDKINKVNAIIGYCLDDIKDIFSFYKYERAYSLEKKFTRLRTLCHILDKGINSTPFERGRGTSIYKEARLLLNQIDRFKDDRAYIWCKNKIVEYEKLQHGNSANIIGTVEPFLYSEEERNFIFKFMKSRISCRNFSSKKIPESIFSDLIFQAVDAPNGCCRQTVRFYVTQNEDLIHKISKNISGITCFSEVPCLVLVTSYSEAYDIIDRKLQFVDASLAVENFVLAARAYNIFTTICNVFHATKDEIHNILNLMNVGRNERLILAIAMGFPNKVPEKPIRMNNDKFLFIR